MTKLQQIRTMLNRLWVRLALAFVLVVFIGVTIGTIINVWMDTRDITQVQGEDVWEREFTFQFTQPNGVLDALHDYYKQNQSWENIEDAMHVVQSFNVPTEQTSVSYSFADENRQVLYNSHPNNLDEWRNLIVDEIFKITIDGRTRGYLRLVAANQIEDFAVAFSPRDYIMISIEKWLRDRAAWMALIGIIVGGVGGILMSRRMAAPLRRLAQAAQAIGSRNLSSRVDVRGSTEVRQLARSFNTMAEDLETAERLRRNLVADVAHELRTPLTVLQGNLRAILDNVYPLTKQEVAGLYDQTRLLSRLVNDLHEIAQAEAKKLPLHMKMSDLAQVIRNIDPIFGPLVEAEDIDFIVQMPDTLPVYGDAARLSQVLHNLLTNALHHTPNGGAITVSGWRDDELVVIAVQDTGSGISAEHLPFVFERFYRVDRSRSRHKGGTGLGLAISKAIVEAHGGSIRAESETQGPHTGTTFTIELPAQPHTQDSLPEERTVEPV